MSKQQTYRWCFVPLCLSIQLKNPEKLFIQVPRNEKVRNLWFKAAHRTDQPTNSNYYCCEDHFNLQEDMENYTRYRLMGGSIRMKQGVVPHIFDCHPGRNTAKSSEPRPGFVKLNRKRTVAEMLADENCPPNFDTDAGPSSKQVEYLPAPEETTAETVTAETVTAVIKNKEPEQTLMKKHFRSKAITAKPSTSTAGCLAKPIMVDKQCSPINLPTTSSSSASATITSKSSLSHSEYNPSPGELSDLAEEQDLEMKQAALRLINYFISTDPKNYIGIMKQWLWIVEDIQRDTEIPSDNIKLTLMKIKKNDTFKRLGDQFGLSTSGASKVFKRSVHKIAHVLKTLIYYPDKENLKKNLPIPFRLNFSEVAGIIDCFEIQIEKPQNALHQALTWSEYKKCNTLKYLICISADGLITLISTGYGGRVSDVELFDQSKIMDVLPDKCQIMADRGFKQIQTILQRKQIELVRPPSVSTKQKSSKEEVLLTKRIASLRIHVERVIRRIREYMHCWNHMPLLIIIQYRI
nr:uncharacterized protein LOC117610999 [Osmia lignaria]